MIDEKCLPVYKQNFYSQFIQTVSVKMCQKVHFYADDTVIYTISGSLSVAKSLFMS